MKQAVDSVAMRKILFPALLSLFFAGDTLHSQQAVAVMHNFKHLPPGLYQQTGQTYHDGKPLGQPVTDTHCAAESSPQMLDSVKQMQAKIAPSCSMKVTLDTPAEAQWVQTCDPGALQTVIRSTSKRVSDRIVTVDTELSKGGQPMTVTHTTLTYMGACPAGMAAPRPGPAKVSAEECADLPQMREEAKSATVQSCHTTDLPADYMARCEAAMKIVQEHMKQLETMCKQ